MPSLVNICQGLTFHHRLIFQRLLFTPLTSRNRYLNRKASTLGNTPTTESTEGSRGQNHFLLSEEYACSSAWDKRLESPLLKKINLEDFFYDIDRKYQTDKTISAVDVDLFANRVTDEENLDELEELTYRLRKSPATIETLPSTGYALVRVLLAHDRTDALIRILNDRMNYGVFIEPHLSNLLMDTFLARGNFRDAAKIASLCMLEEDFGPSTSKLFSLLSCLKYLESPTPAPWEPEPEKVEESKEEVKVRVKYQRNPFFDDHFELTNPQHIIGKTLAFLSIQFEDDQLIRNSIELLGWALFDKWDSVEATLRKLIAGKLNVAEEVVKKVTELVDARLSEVEASPNKSLPKPQMKSVPGLNLDPAEVADAFAKLHWDQRTVRPLESVKSILAESKLVTENVNLISATKELLSKVIVETQQSEVEALTATYEAWDKIRNDELEKQVTKFREIQTLLEIQSTKKELARREDTIFFFDNEEEWMMRQPKVVAEPTETVDAKGYIKKVKKPKEDDNTYISPDVKRS